MEILFGIIALVWFLAVLHYVQRTAQILAKILKILETLWGDKLLTNKERIRMHLEK